MRPVFIAAVVLLAALAPRGAAAQDRARELTERALASQHRDDAALYRYERIERRIVYEDDSVVSDRTYRLVPTGTGRLSLLIKRGHQPVDQEFYRDELRAWQEVLTHAVDPGDGRQQHSDAQRVERDEHRAELIDSISHAFRPTWLGEEVSNGRTLARIRFDPDPSFRPTSRFTEMLGHVRAVAWIDEQDAQLVRADVEITSDISLGGGIAGKIYRGGRIHIEQSQVAPGIWLPTSEEHWLRVRKLFLASNEHTAYQTSRYRLIGTPHDAILEVRNELTSGNDFSVDP